MTTLSAEMKRRLVSLSCNEFRLIEGGTLILYVGDKNDPEISPRYTMWINCAWRLCGIDGMKVGSLDDSAKVLESLLELKGNRLTVVEVDQKTGDLVICFATGVFIEAFCYSVQDEQWELRGADGLRIGIGPDNSPFERYEEIGATHKLAGSGQETLM